MGLESAANKLPAPIPEVSHALVVVKDNEKPGILRKIVNKICSVVYAIFSTLFCCFPCFGSRSKIDPKVKEKLALAIHERHAHGPPAELMESQSLQQAQLSPILQPKTPSETLKGEQVKEGEQVVSGEGEKAETTTEIAPESHPLIGSVDTLSDKSSTHALARTLVGGIVEGMTEKYMKEEVDQHLINISAGAESLKKEMTSLSNTLIELKDKFYAAVAKNLPANLTDDENAEPFLLLFDLLDIVVLVKTHFDPQFSNAKLRRIVENYIYGLPQESSEEIDLSERKPAVDWLPENSHCYIPPAIDWLFENFSHQDENPIITPFEEFITANQEKYKITPEQYRKDQRTILEGFLSKISSKIFNSAQSSLQDNIEGINVLTNPEALRKTVHELINVNAHIATGVVTDRLFALMGEVEFSQLIHQSLPLLRQKLEGKPGLLIDKAKEQEILTEKGDQLVDLIFPIVKDPKSGRIVRALALLWDQAHIPQQLNKLFSSIQSIPGLKLNDMSKRSLHRILRRNLNRIALFVQVQLNARVAKELQKIMDKVTNPAFVHEMMANELLPNVMDKVLAIFIREILSKNIDSDFALLFNTLVQSKDEESEMRETEEIVSRLYVIVTTAEKGFKHFKPFQKDVMNEDKFCQLVEPLIIEMKKHLIAYQKANKGELNKKQLKAALDAFFKPSKDQPPEGIKKGKKVENPMREEFIEIVKTVLHEGEFFKDTFGGSLVMKGADAYGVDPLGELLMEAIPTTDELLAITFNSLKEMWTTEQIENGVRVRRVDLKKVLGEEVAETTEEAEIMHRLDARFTQLTALSSDFVSAMAYHSIDNRLIRSIAYKGTQRYLGPESLKSAVVKVYNKLFSDKEKNKGFFYPMFGLLISQLKEAHKHLQGAHPLVGRAQLITTKF